jgi:hypothetical protein
MEQSATPQDSEFRELPDITQYPDTTVQELLQLVPETRHVERQNTRASSGLDRSSLGCSGNR